MTSTYTIWSQKRDKKEFVTIDDNVDNTYLNLIQTASSMLEIDGSSIVLEKDGTPVDESMLPEVKTEILILLQKDEVWKSPDAESLASTVTILSTDTVPNLSEYLIDYSDPNHWVHFAVPYSRLTKTELDQFESGIKDRNTVTRLILLTVKAMCDIQIDIPSKAFKTVAKKITDRYPDIFREVDDNNITLSDGSPSLSGKLEDFYGNLHPFYRTSASPVRTIISLKRKRYSMNPRSSRCSSERTKSDDNHFYELCEKSYSAIRNFLSAEVRPTISEIQEEWPILFSKRSIYWHFRKLTNSNIDLLDKFGAEAGKILQHIAIRRTSEGNKENENPDDVALIAMLAIAAHLKEDIESFFIECEEQLKQPVLHKLPVTPCVVQLGSGAGRYYCYVERQNIDQEGYCTFLEALKVAFCLFFILKLEFPPEIQSTLGLLQLYYCQIYPDNASIMTEAKHKILTFIRRFEEFKHP